MAKERKIISRKWGNASFTIEEPGSYHDYKGKISCLKNETSYAIIYERECPAVSGPSITVPFLIEAGEIKNKNLEEILLKRKDEVIIKEKRGEKWEI